jgi:phosphohistidine phosphatase
MKTLLLLRHAKSVKNDGTLVDFERSLNDRGKDDAKLIGTFLGDQKLAPDLILSSPAKRARTTTELVLKAADWNCTPQFDERIYEASLYRLLNVVSEIDSSNKVVMLVGHNPGFEELLAALTDESPGLPTCAAASIDLKVNDWGKAGVHAGKLKWLVTPKSLKREETSK